MFRRSLLLPRSAIAATSALHARVSKVGKAEEDSKLQADSKKEAASAADEKSPETFTYDEPDSHDREGTHVRPQTILKDILQSISAGQHTFLFGSNQAARDAGDKSPRANGTFFESINTAYEGRMLQEQQIEVGKYLEKRRLYYAQRVDEETEEFRQEQKAIHEEIERFAAQKYMSELDNDIVQFTKNRVAEYEERLKADVEKYYNALLAYRSRMKKSAAGKSTAKALSLNLNSRLQAVIDEMELEDAISDFGDAAGSGNDITDKDIRAYVVQRTCFYEQCAQDEAHDFTVSRRTFYEELLEARTIRHAAKVRSDTERFRKERQEYYDQCLTNDSEWMTQCFKEHYDRCFLQSYARIAWLDHRRYQATREGIKIFQKKGERIPAISNPSNISVAALNEEIPLSKILDIYESENIAEASRDAFLKAARRVANSPDHINSD